MTRTERGPDIDVEHRARTVEMLLLDVDGVLTDGGIVYVGDGLEAKRFDAQDGMGITLARAADFKVGIMTGRSSAAVRRRAEELGIDEIWDGVADKAQVLESVLERHDLRATQIAYLGDDLPDLSILRRVGLPLAVQNARDEVKQECVHVSRASGGHGAVREIIEWILDAKGILRTTIDGLVGPRIEV
jgi:3-deoxy-D-manno-octulosonate 8-phosphate phosphatase (KDO 8-P phosphatase)